MASTSARLTAALSLVVALAACGSDTKLSRDDAMKAAMDVVAQDVADPGSPAYHHRVELRSATEVAPKRWLVVIKDHTDGSLICVRILSEDGAIVPQTNLDVARCGPPTAPAPTTTSPSA